jgi:NADPH:quinone reductase-like Zn-dependent oxidoreductase
LLQDTGETGVREMRADGIRNPGARREAPIRHRRHQRPQRLAECGQRVFRARRRGIPAILLVRSAAARDALHRLGVAHVVDIAEDRFETGLGALAAALGATSVFDGVGGETVSRIAPVLPPNSTVSFYGLLSGATPIAVPSLLFMAKNLVMKRFSNFESATARDPERLLAAMADLDGIIADPMLRTRIGREFRFGQIGEAMAYEEKSGGTAVLIP